MAFISPQAFSLGLVNGFDFVQVFATVFSSRHFSTNMVFKRSLSDIVMASEMGQHSHTKWSHIQHIMTIFFII